MTNPVVSSREVTRSIAMSVSKLKLLSDSRDGKKRVLEEGLVSL